MLWSLARPVAARSPSHERLVDRWASAHAPPCFHERAPSRAGVRHLVSGDHSGPHHWRNRMRASERFEGTIGRTYKESEPWWPPLPEDEHGERPNVLVVLFDDTGFAHFGCYGSTIDTPNIDALAADGLRFSNFHVTPLCLADPCVAADRAESSRRRHAHGGELPRWRVPQYAGLRQSPRGDDGRDPAGAGLRHVCARQVASEPRGGELRRRTLRQLAPAARLRSLLRFSAGRHRSVLPRADVRQPPHRPAQGTGAGLPRQRGSR